jgi:hypothetical protein
MILCVVYYMPHCMFIVLGTCYCMFAVVYILLYCVYFLFIMYVLYCNVYDEAFPGNDPTSEA